MKPKISKKHLIPVKSLDLFVPVILADIMSAYGYNSINQQVALMKLLEINNIDIKYGFKNRSLANDWFKNATQKLLRKGERWSFENQKNINKLESHRDKIINIADDLGMLNFKKPALKNNYVAVLPGALESRVYDRIKIIKDAIKEGYKFTKVVAVTGYRKLQDTECLAITDESKRTEADMIEFVWHQEAEKFPELKNLEFEVSVAKKKSNKDRSNTEDTVREFNVKNQNILVCIEQPYASRFYSIFNTILRPKNNTVSVFTNTIEKHEIDDLLMFQDEIARRVYFLYNIVSKKYKSVKTKFAEVIGFSFLKKVND